LISSFTNETIIRKTQKTRRKRMAGVVFGENYFYFGAVMVLVWCTYGVCGVIWLFGYTLKQAIR